MTEKYSVEINLEAKNSALVDQKTYFSRSAVDDNQIFRNFRNRFETWEQMKDDYYIGH
ncbi:Uncharacterised protein [uncultured archaeon]|nr:Uncharacterised protein [uncultured archaeon]